MRYDTYLGWWLHFMYTVDGIPISKEVDTIIGTEESIGP